MTKPATRIKKIFKLFFTNRILPYLVVSRVLVLVTAHLTTGILIFATRWDGNSYTFIAQNWYVTQGSEATFIVFPPFFPILIKILTLITSNSALAGFLLANFFFVAGIYLFYQLTKNVWATILVCLFPTSYFFSTSYPESLFFFLFIATFWFGRQKKFLPASLVAGLATLTRPFGILLWPALFIEWFQKDKRLKNLIAMFLLATVAAGSYLATNYQVHGNPFAFQEFLKTNWQKSLAFPWEGIISSWKRGIFTTKNLEFKYLVGYAEGMTSTIAWLFVPLVFIKKLKIPLSWGVYYTLGVILFTATGFILSAPRYLLSLPPFFILLAKSTKPPVLKIFLLTLFLPGLVYLTYLFSLGHWAF